MTGRVVLLLEHCSTSGGAMDEGLPPGGGTGYGQGVIIVGLGLAFRSGCNRSLAHF